MRLYDRWRYLNWAREVGIEKEYWVNWAELLDDDRYSVVMSFFDAGFKSTDLIEVCLKRGMSANTLSDLKKEFLNYGIPEHEVEDWLFWFIENYCCYGYFNEHLKVFGYAYQNITKDISILSALVHFENENELKDSLEVLINRGFTKDEALQELWALYRLESDTRLKYIHVHNWLYKADIQNFKTMSILLAFDEDNAELIKERINFYRSLGFSQVLAEWWAGCEVRYIRLLNGIFLNESEIAFWSSEGVNNLIDINYLLLNYLTCSSFRKNQKKYAFLYKYGLDYQWASTGLDKQEIENWLSLGVGYFKFEKLGNKIDYQTFKRLLDKSWCNVSCLITWLEDENYNIETIESWLDAGIKDYVIANELKKRDFTPERMKELFKKFSLEYILRAVDEGAKYQDLVQSIMKNQVAKRFKR